jgi:hypothetical protein
MNPEISLSFSNEPFTLTNAESSQNPFLQVPFLHFRHIDFYIFKWYFPFRFFDKRVLSVSRFSHQPRLSHFPSFRHPLTRTRTVKVLTVHLLVLALTFIYEVFFSLAEHNISSASHYEGLGSIPG